MSHECISGFKCPKIKEISAIASCATEGAGVREQDEIWSIAHSKMMDQAAGCPGPIPTVEKNETQLSFPRARRALGVESTKVSAVVSYDCAKVKLYS